MGAKVKPKIKNSQQAVLFALLDHYGGPTKVMEILRKSLKSSTISRQMYYNWAKRGSVPVKQVFKVAAALNVPAHALNYEELLSFYPSNPSWTRVIADIKFLDKRKRADILSKKHPKN